MLNHEVYNSSSTSIRLKYKHKILPSSSTSTNYDNES